MVLDAIDTNKFDATYFEIVTMIGFLHFQAENVDYVVLECGLGGRGDATSVATNSVCTAITSIGLDHMEILGNTLEEIAFEKAGIIKENVPIIVGVSVTQDIVK